MSLFVEDGFAQLPDGGEIAYQVRGRGHRGLPILLIRPPGGSMSLWGSFRSALSERFRVVSFDHRGAGRSSPSGWTTTRDLARDSLRVLDHLGIDRAHVFGFSLGGMAATWMPILAPKRVAKLCLASTPARGLELTRAGLRREFKLAACVAKRTEEVEPCFVDRILSRRFRDVCAAEVGRIERVLRAVPAARRDLMRFAVAGLLHDARRALPRVRVPTLVLAGECDDVLGMKPSGDLAAAIPGSELAILASCGHDITLEQPIATAARVSEFFLRS